MGRAKKSGRGSPEAVAKRRVARALNQLFERGTEAAMDGRTLKRKKRLMKELKEGRRGAPLKAVEALQCVDELLKLGETLTSIRRLKPKVPPAPPPSEETAASIAQVQEQYGFDPRAWKVLGVDIEGGSQAPAKKKAAARKKAARKKAPTKSKRAKRV
jgi:hypothetical protein